MCFRDVAKAIEPLTHFNIPIRQRTLRRLEDAISACCNLSRLWNSLEKIFKRHLGKMQMPDGLKLLEDPEHQAALAQEEQSIANRMQEKEKKQMTK